MVTLSKMTFCSQNIFNWILRNSILFNVLTNNTFLFIWLFSMSKKLLNAPRSTQVLRVSNSSGESSYVPSPNRFSFYFEIFDKDSKILYLYLLLCLKRKTLLSSQEKWFLGKWFVRPVIKLSHATLPPWYFLIQYLLLFYYRSSKSVWTTISRENDLLVFKYLQYFLIFNQCLLNGCDKSASSQGQSS